MGLFSPGGGGKRQRKDIRRNVRRFATFENFQTIFKQQKDLIRESIASGLGPQFQATQAAALARTGLGQGSVLGRQLSSAIAGAPSFFASANALPAAQQFQSQQIQSELGLLGAVDPAEASLFDNIARVAGTVFPAIGIAQSLGGGAKTAASKAPGSGGGGSFTPKFA